MVPLLISLSAVVIMAESQVGTNQKDEILARRAKLLRAHQFARTLANQVIQAPQEEAAVAPAIPTTEPTSQPTPPPASPHQHSCPNQNFESNGFASFESADTAPPAPTDEQRISCGLAGLELNSLPNMLVNAKQQEQSRLMLLPAELRNRIYSLALDDLWVDIYPSGHDLLPDVTNAPGILLSCKRIYYEATGIYYSNTTFHNDPGYGRDQATSNERLKQWLTCIGYKRASQIKEIRTTMNEEHDIALWRSEVDQATDVKHIKACLEEIHGVRRLAEDIYGRTVWGPEVIKSSLTLRGLHGWHEIWTPDPWGLYAEALAAYDQVSHNGTD